LHIGKFFDTMRASARHKSRLNARIFRKDVQDKSWIPKTKIFLSFPRSYDYLFFIQATKNTLNFQTFPDMALRWRANIGRQ
jgi:hypothetical protein